MTLIFAAISALCALLSIAAAYIAARYWRYARRTRDQIANAHARINLSLDDVSSEQLRREIVRLQREGKIGGGR